MTTFSSGPGAHGASGPGNDVMRFAQTRPRMTPDERWNMMAHLLRLPELYAYAMVQLRPEYFTEPDEPHLKLAWRAAMAVEEDLDRGRLFGSRLRAWSLVSEKAKVILAEDPQLLPGDFYDQLFGVQAEARGLLSWVYDHVHAEELDSEHGRRLLQRFLEERYVQDPVRLMIANARGANVVDLPMLLREAGDRHLTVATLGESPVQEAVPENWRPQPIHKRSTGLDFLDQVMGGGHVNGEVQAVLGCSGSGKTTLAVQLAVAAADIELERFDDHRDTPLQYSYLFHYEAGADEMRCRVVSHVAQIARDSVAAWDMSTRGHLKTYEQILFSQEVVNFGVDGVNSEIDRFYATVPRINRSLRLIDMSGPKEKPKQGSGGVDEVAAVLEMERRQGRTPCCVVIDYAGLCVSRQVLENRLAEKMEYSLLKTFGHDCLRKIAVPFDTPVWVMHQLSGESNARGWGARQSHADAQGCKSFSENMWYSFQLGVPNHEHKAMQLFCTKARRSDAGTPKLVYLQMPVSTMRLAEHLVNMNGQLVTRGAGMTHNADNGHNGPVSACNGAASAQDLPMTGLEE
jgi:hypothetical protein